MKRTLVMVASALVALLAAAAVAVAATPRHHGGAGYGPGNGYGDGAGHANGYYKDHTAVSGKITAVNGSSFTATVYYTPAPAEPSYPYPYFGGYGFNYAPGYSAGPNYGHGYSYAGYNAGADHRGGGYGPYGPYGSHDTTTTGTTTTGTTTAATTTTGAATTPAPTKPTAQTVTISTDSSTKFDVNGNRKATASDLQAGQHFIAYFNGSDTDTLSQLVANPALKVLAISKPARPTLYGFVGTVTAVNTSASPETVSVAVTKSNPSGEFSGTDTFTVAPSTFVFGGSGNSPWGAGLSNVSVGDTVSGGLIGPAGQTAAQIEAEPLQVLFDLPSGTHAAQLDKAHTAAFNKAHSWLKREQKALRKADKKK